MGASGASVVGLGLEQEGRTEGWGGEGTDQFQVLQPVEEQVHGQGSKVEALVVVRGPWLEALSCDVREGGPKCVPLVEASVAEPEPLGGELGGVVE